MVVSPIGAIPYRYGPDSFVAHHQAAAAAGLALENVRRPGLSFDIDTPDDLEQMEEIERERVSSGLLHLWVALFPESETFGLT